MGWRFVEQPNGKLARFSEIVDAFTEYDMTDNEAIELAIDEYNCGRKTATEKVQRARDAKGERWTEALRIIKTVHGRDYLKEHLAEIGFPVVSKQTG